MINKGGKKLLVNVINNGTLDANPELAVGKKISCWQCYKLFHEEKTIKSGSVKDKVFCTEVCVAKYE